MGINDLAEYWLKKYHNIPKEEKENINNYGDNLTELNLSKDIPKQIDKSINKGIIENAKEGNKILTEVNQEVSQKLGKTPVIPTAKKNNQNNSTIEEKIAKPSNNSIIKEGIAKSNNNYTNLIENISKIFAKDTKTNSNLENKKSIKGNLGKYFLDFANSFGRTLADNSGKNTGQMVGNIFVPNTRIDYSSLTRNMQNVFQEKLNKNTAIQKEKELSQASTSAKIAQIQKQANKNREFDLKEKLINSKLTNSKLTNNALNSEQLDTISKQKKENVSKSLKEIEDLMLKSKDLFGTGTVNWLQRTWGNVIGTTKGQNLKDLENKIVTYMSSNIRLMDAYKQGILTDIDFENAVKGMFDSSSSLKANIENINNKIRDFNIKETEVGGKSFIPEINLENILVQSAKKHIEKQIND